MRFISEDTYRGNYEDPLSLNYYTYAHNNPLIYTDPDGHSIQGFLWDIGKGLIREGIEQLKNEIIGTVMGIGRGLYEAIRTPVSYGIGILAEIVTLGKVSGQDFIDNSRFNANEVQKDIEDRVVTREKAYNDGKQAGAMFSTALSVSAGIGGMSSMGAVSQGALLTSTGQIYSTTASISTSIGSVAQVAAGAGGVYSSIQNFEGNNGIGNNGEKQTKESTGRTKASNLNEQLTMKEIKSKPLENAKELPIKLNDSRWSSSDGWVKMERTKTYNNGTKTTVHFNYNKKTGAFDDFKFK